MSKISLSLDYLSYNLNFFLHHETVFSIVSSDRFSSFTSTVFGMSVKDFLDISARPSFWLLRVFQVDFKQKVVGFTRGLNGGGQHQSRDAYQTINYSQNDQIREIVQEIKEGLNQGLVKKENIKRLKEIGYFSFDRPAWIFEELYPIFIKGQINVNKNSVHQSKKIVRMLRTYLHISSLHIYPESELKTLRKNFNKDELQKKIKDLKELVKVEEYELIIELETIHSLIKYTGRNWWEKLNKKCLILFKLIIGRRDNEDDSQLRCNYMITYIKDMKKSFKSLSICLNHLLEPKNYSNEQLDMIILELIKHMQKSPDQQFGVIILFLAKIMKKNKLSPESINNIFERLDFETINSFSLNKILGVLHLIEQLKCVDSETIQNGLNAVTLLLDNVESVPSFVRDIHKLRLSKNWKALDDKFLNYSNIKVNFFEKAFFGRDFELAIMRKSLIEDIEDKRKSNILAIYGAKGVGKSELALEYAKTYENFYNYIFLIDASNNESIESDLHQCFNIIMNMSGLEELMSLSDFLRTCEYKILFIFDNLQSSESFLKFCVLRRKIHFIVTSVVELLIPSNIQQSKIELKGLDHRNSTLMVRELLVSPWEKTPFNSLLCRTEETKPSVLKLLAIFSNSKIELPTMNISRMSDEFVSSSFKRICNDELQVFILKIVKILSSKIIPEKLLKDIFLSCKEENDWKLSRLALLGTSLVREEGAFWLINEFISSQFPFQPSPELKKLVVLKVTELKLDYYNIPNNRELGFFYYKYAIHLKQLDQNDLFCNSFLEVFINSFKFNVLKIPINEPAQFFNKFYEIIETDDFRPEHKLKLAVQISQLCIDFRFFGTAKTYLKMIFKIVSFDSFSDVDLQLRINLNLAISYMKLELFDKSGICFNRYYQIQNPLNFNDDLFWMFFGEFESKCKRYENSQAYFEYSLQMAQLKPQNCLKDASLKLRAAKDKLEQSRFEECKELLSQSMKILRNIHDYINPDFAEILQISGILYFNQGEFEKSEKKLLKCLKLQVKLFGEDHSEQALTYYYLGKINSRTGLKQGLKFYEKYLSITNTYKHEFSIGRDEKLFLIGIQYFNERNINGAFIILNEIIEKGNKEDYHKAEVFLYLGKIHMIRSDLSSALQSFENCLSITGSLELDPIKKFKILLEISRYKTTIGQFNKSEENLNEIAKYVRNPSCSDPVFKFSALLEFGYLHYCRLDPHKALNFFNECLDLNDRINETSEPLLVASLYLRRGENYLLLDMKEQSLNDLIKSYEIRRNFLPDSDSEIAEILQALGRFYLKTGKYQEAESYFSNCLNIKDSLRFSQENHQGMLSIWLDLGILYTKKYGNDKSNEDFSNYAYRYITGCYHNHRTEFDLSNSFNAKMTKAYADLEFIKEENENAIIWYEHFLTIVDSWPLIYSEKLEVYENLARVFDAVSRPEGYKKYLLKCYDARVRNLNLPKDSLIKLCFEIIEYYKKSEKDSKEIEVYLKKLQQLGVNF